MHVERIGSGTREHFLCIHGWAGGWSTYTPLEPYLPEDVTLWCVDMPGYGQSPPPSDWRYELVAQELVETSRDLDVPLTLLGNCSGAAYGLMAELAEPGLFQRLVLIDPFAYFPWYFDLLVSKPFGRMFYATAFENPFGRWLTNQGLAEHRTEETDLTSSFEELDHGVVFEYLRMLKQMPSYQSCATIRQPVSVLHGENTFGAVRDSISKWSEIWPHLQVHEMRGAGHLPIQEATEQLAAATFGG